MLYWQSLGALEADYTISVRLLQNGAPIEGQAGPLIQDHQPVWNRYPTSFWRPDERVADAYVLPLSTAVQPEQLQLVVYRSTADGFVNLDVKTIDLK
jgi:hypothetical protein